MNQRIHAFNFTLEKQEFSYAGSCEEKEEQHMVKDVGWKNFLSDDSRCADIINGIGCGGKQIVTEDDLQEADTQVGTKYRDCVRKVAFGVNFAIVGIENQEEKDYSLPLRNMTYDAVMYEKQAATIRKEVRKNSKGLEAGEYLYGFRKDDKVHPVITFVLYAGTEDWDGATSLHEILDFESIPEELREMVSDYKVNFVDIRKIKDTSVFQTDVRQVFDIIQCEKDKDALNKLVSNDPSYKNMEQDAFDLAVHYTKMTEMIKVKEHHMDEKGGVNMCQALTELLQDSKEEGREEGIVLAKRIFGFCRDGKSNEEIAKECNITAEKVAEILA